MYLVLELPMREPACGDFCQDYGRELVAWRRVLQGVAETTDGLLATSVQPFLGLAHAFLTTLHHRCRGGSLWRTRRNRCLSRTPRDFRPSGWRARLGQPGQSETARRVEVVLQKFLDAFWLGAMFDKLPRKALVKFQRVTLRTMLRIVDGQYIVPLGIHLVTVGTCQGFAGNLFYALGVEVELMVQFDGAGIA